MIFADCFGPIPGHYLPVAPILRFRKQGIIAVIDVEMRRVLSDAAVFVSGIACNQAAHAGMDLVGIEPFPGGFLRAGRDVA